MLAHKTSQYYGLETSTAEGGDFAGRIVATRTPSSARPQPTRLSDLKFADGASAIAPIHLPPVLNVTAQNDPAECRAVFCGYRQSLSAFPHHQWRTSLCACEQVAPVTARRQEVTRQSCWFGGRAAAARWRPMPPATTPQALPTARLAAPGAAPGLLDMAMCPKGILIERMHFALHFGHLACCKQAEIGSVISVPDVHVRAPLRRSVQEREQEYHKARARIFGGNGTAAAGASPEQQQPHQVLLQQCS